MNRTSSIISLATLLTICAGSAFAANQQSLSPVFVSGNSSVDCTPPNDAKICAEWHAQIRRNFSKREIGVLFGAATAYPENLTSTAKLQTRYRALAQEFATNNHMTLKVASK